MWPSPDFNPRLPRGRRLDPKIFRMLGIDFNPRLPRGRRRPGNLAHRLPDEFQSTPPAREATRAPGDAAHSRRILIHASREGGDGVAWSAREKIAISIHASREGGDYYGFSSGPPPSDFNPRLPRGRRLGRAIQKREPTLYFNPRLPRGRRPGYIKSLPRLIAISIHASREGGDARQT